jgi:hypothetical protein
MQIVYGISTKRKKSGKQKITLIYTLYIKIINKLIRIKIETL